MKNTLWITIEAISIFLESLLCIMSILLVWRLSLPIHTKIVVIFAFSIHLFVVIPVAFRLISIRSFSTTDIPLNLSNVVLATQIVMHYSTMAATFPCFRQFLQVFDSGLGATTGIGKRPEILGDIALETIGGSHQGSHPTTLRRTSFCPTHVHDLESFPPTDSLTDMHMQMEERSTRSEGSQEAIIPRNSCMTYQS